MKEKLLVIGNGMAANRLLERLVEFDANRYDIMVFDANRRLNNAPRMMSLERLGEKPYPDIIAHDEDWYAEHGIRLLMSTPVETINTDEQWVCTAGGVQFDYDKLVIATGADPIMVPLLGHTLQGVHVHRDLDDVDYLQNIARNKRRAVVIGGDLPGLQAAVNLEQQGMDVCVVHLGEQLMARQLDSKASFLLRRELERCGIDIRTATRTSDILGDSQVQGLHFADGSETACELVIMAIGNRPSTRLATQAGLAVNHGIVVDDALRTSVDNVHALGECVEPQGKCHGLVALTHDMAEALASTLTGKPASFSSTATAMRLKVNGVDMYSAGRYPDNVAESGLEDIILRDATAGIYKRLVLEGPRLVGIVLYGDTSDADWYADLLRAGTDISEMRDILIFGQAFQEGAERDPSTALAALSDDAEIFGSADLNQDEVRSQSLAKRLQGTPSE